jgi:hypothetical protein
MKVAEMRTVAQATLADFIRTMPDVPFTEGDIIIEFAPRNKLVERFTALCEMCCTRRILNETQAAELAANITANAIIGENKSAVLVRIDYKISKQGLRSVMFHEFMHIFCGKTEIDGKHFIDIYGSGTTPDESPTDRVYDGELNAGHVVWSEFIAQYYALLHEHKQNYSVTNLTNELFGLLNEVHNAEIHKSKTAFAMFCSYLLSCADTESFIELLDEPDFLFDERKPFAMQVRTAFKNCLLHIQSNLKNEKPWKITETYIAELGERFIVFRGMNTLYLGSTGSIETDDRL